MGTELGTETTEWIDCKVSLPDEGMIVNVYSPLADEPVWIGYLEDGIWRDVDSGRYHTPVTHWSDLLKGPSCPTQ